MCASSGARTGRKRQCVAPACPIISIHPLSWQTPSSSSSVPSLSSDANPLSFGRKYFLCCIWQLSRRMTEAGYWLPAFCRQRWQLWPSLLYLAPAPQQLPTFHTPAKRKSSLPGSNMSSMPGSRLPWRQKPTVFLQLEAITRYYRPLSLKSSADVKRQLISPCFLGFLVVVVVVVCQNCQNTQILASRADPGGKAKSRSCST